MAVTLEQLDSFHRFATEKLNNGDTDLSIEECLQLWMTDLSQSDVVADIREGIEDEKAGRLRPLKEVDADIRRELGFSK